MVMMDKWFRPSKELGTYLYSVYLNIASVRELEEDIILKNTYWILASKSNDACVNFDIWFDKDLGVTINPLKVGSKISYNADTGKVEYVQSPVPVAKLGSYGKVYECENLAGKF